MRDWNSQAGQAAPRPAGLGQGDRTSDCPDVTKEMTMGKRVGEPGANGFFAFTLEKNKNRGGPREAPSL